MTAPPAGALEACPCCGGEAATSTARTTDRDYIRLNKRDTGYGVNCISCGLTNRGIAIGYATEADAIAAWNRRAHGPALLAALRLREWRPIESAPKDGSNVLIFCKGAGVAAIAFFCEDSGSWMSIAGETFAHPIMWMPAPLPTADDLARVLEQTK